MTFREFLTHYRDDRTNWPVGAINRILTLPDWPDTLANDGALNAWLKRSDTPRPVRQAARQLWTRYQQRFGSDGRDDTGEADKPLYSPPKPIMAVVQEPPLERLSELGHELRLVARRGGGGPWHWYGDLDDVIQLRTYYVMIHITNTAMQVTRYISDGIERHTALLARIVEGVDPGKAYSRAAGAVQADVARGPAWLRLRQPLKDLEAMR